MAISESSVLVQSGASYTVGAQLDSVRAVKQQEIVIYGPDGKHLLKVPGVAMVVTEAGVPIIAVRKDATGAFTGVDDGDYSFLQVDSNGRLKTAASTTISGSVTIGQIPETDRTTDTIASTLELNGLMYGRTHVTVIFAKGTIAASTTDGSLISSTASQKIRVLQLRLSNGGGTLTSLTLNTKPAGAGTAISEPFWAAVNGGGMNPTAIPLGLCETSAGEGLAATTSAGSTLSYGVVAVKYVP